MNILSVMQVFSDCLLHGTVPDLLLTTFLVLRIKEVCGFGNMRDERFFESGLDLQHL